MMSTIKLLVIARVLLFMQDLAPARTSAEFETRREIAEAIIAVTDDVHEQNLLASIARHESGYADDVLHCERFGKAGEVTAWQILPRSVEERKRLCVSVEGDAQVALERVRESLTSCRGLRDERDRLAVYTRGSCANAEGRRLSRIRWVR